MRLDSERIWSRVVKIRHQAKKTTKQSCDQDELASNFVEENFAAMASKVQEEASSSSGGRASTPPAKGAETKSPPTAPAPRQLKQQTSETDDIHQAMAEGWSGKKPLEEPPAQAGSEKKGSRRGSQKQAHIALQSNSGKRKRAAAQPAEGEPVGKRGRPTANHQDLLNLGLVELAAAAAGDKKYLGVEWKSVKRNWDYYVSRLNLQIRDADSDETLHGLQKTEKSAKVAIAVLSQFAKSGMISAESCQVYVSQMNFCQREPEVANPFSPYVRGLMHSSKVEAASSPAELWPQLFQGEIFCSCSEAKVGEKQKEFAVEKVTQTVQNQKGASMEKVSQALRDLCESFWSLSSSFNQPLLIDSMQQLTTLALAPKWPLEMSVEQRFAFFAKILEVVRAPSAIGAALEAFPVGRHIIALAIKQIG